MIDTGRIAPCTELLNISLLSFCRLIGCLESLNFANWHQAGGVADEGSIMLLSDKMNFLLFKGNNSCSSTASS